MKILTSCLLILALLSGLCAYALIGTDYPAPRGDESANALTVSIDGKALALEFDPSATYISDGYLTACYYCFNESQTDYLEFYLLLPENVASGDSFDSESLASILLYEVHNDGTEDLYYSYLGIPDGSTIDIRIEQCEVTAQNIHLCGTLSGWLGSDVALPGGTMLTLENGSFDLTFPIGSGISIPTPEPELPEATPAPAVYQPTLPPDRVRL